MVPWWAQLEGQDHTAPHLPSCQVPTLGFFPWQLDTKNEGYEYPKSKTQI